MNIKELAEQANKRLEPNWPGGVIWYWGDLERFAELVAAHEREECAKMVDDWERDEAFVDNIADAIRARSKA
jgi:hypothetical protein